MATYYYHRFNCQVCGKRTRTKKSPVKGDFNGRQCHVCGRLICYKCSVGGFCKTCFESFPKDNRESYEKQAKKLKNLKYSYYYIILLCCFLFVSSGLLSFIAPEIASFAYAGSGILFVYLCCPGLIIQIMVLHNESKFTDSEAKLFLRKYPKLKNPFNNYQ